MWIDSHSHLNDETFREDYRQVLAVAASQNIEAVIVPGFDLTSSERAVELAVREPMIWAAVGIHPHDAKNWNNETAGRLEALLRESKVVALGEIGLDYHYQHSAKEEQFVAFKEQLDLAAKYNKPVIIHNREAHQDTLAVLTGFSARQGLTANNGGERFGGWGVMHCYSGSLEMAIQCIKMGLLISFAGAITFTNAVKLREVAGRLPLDRLLVETDAPYLSPHPLRGRRNEPSRVTLVGTKLAEIKGLPVEDVMKTTTANCKQLFKIP